MEDVLDIYLQPIGPLRPRVCFDERPTQLLGDVIAPIPISTGQAKRIDYLYERFGSVNLFMMVAPFLGWREVKATETRKKVDFAHCMKDLVDVHFPDATVKATLSANLPPLRLILIMDNLIGHKNPAWLVWCFQHGRTPLGGSWLNMAESIQRILKRRALDGFHPHDVQTIIDRLEMVARHWNTKPTPFIWNGKRRQRRHRASLHRLGGSGATTLRPIERLNQWRRSQQLTHYNDR